MTPEVHSIIRMVISGGQTGADMGALEAAIELGFTHGGYCPKGRRCEIGVIPPQFDLWETDSSDYRVRTRRNIEESDITIIFTRNKPLSGGSLFTRDLCKRTNKPFVRVILCDKEQYDIKAIAASILSRLKKLAVQKQKILVVNVAGGRESKSPGLQRAVRDVMHHLLSGECCDMES
jgi:hypothetical protein